MKYIRTKDGVFKVRPRFAEEYLWENSVYVCKHEHIKNQDIIAQADTIEELCDEFVIEDNGHCISDLYTIKRLLVKNKLTIYGAIWVDRGLIYVAKMNEDGVLCLLG